MNEFVALINSKLPKGLVYGKLNNTDKSVIKGMFKAYDMAKEFNYPKVEGFPTANEKAQMRIAKSAMEAFRVSIVEEAINYIMSLQEENNDKKVKESAI